MFPAWDVFYEIVGAAAGALTGLNFVVIALIAEFRGSEEQIEAFGTPTVVHFGAALMLAAIVTAPWPAIIGLQLALGIFGTAGVVYMSLVMRRARRQTGYDPVFEDWLFHAALPLSAYAAVLVAAFLLSPVQTTALFVVGGG